MKAHIKNYLSVTKKEWNGMVVFIILIALVLAAPYVYQTLRKDNIINFNEFDKAVALLSRGKNVNPGSNSSADDEKPAHAVLFTFNPNHLSDASWQKPGLSEHQIRVIKNYEAKGGRFYSKEDVKKIYSITPADYQRLEPYITIPGNIHYANKAAPGEIIEINSADSAKLTRIRGIGPAFAMRIIRYRDRLGGFYSKEQLKEVFGIDDAKYAEIKNGIAVNGKHIIKINVNTATFNQLRRFPYMSFKQMNAILEYHTQHGDYESFMI
jgi:competence ComEA-like helix-hairpin-helix protein